MLANLGKRLVKAPKLYFVDLGLAYDLLLSRWLGKRRTGLSAVFSKIVLSANERFTACNFGQQCGSSRTRSNAWSSG